MISRHDRLAKDISLDASIYRPLFQQPILNIKQKSPPLIWFEFLLDSSLLSTHILRLQKDATSAPTAFELISLFLDEAETLACEEACNARYYALLNVAATFVIELKLTLEDIEKQVDFARQWPLMEGISRWKETVGTTMASDDVVDEKTEMTRWYRNRWIVRSILKQANQCCLRGQSHKENTEVYSEMERQFPPITTILFELKHDLTNNHMEDKSPWKMKTCCELGEYYFTTNCFNSALEFFQKSLHYLLELEKNQRQLERIPMKNVKGKLTGYIHACHALVGTVVKSMQGDDVDLYFAIQHVEQNVEKQEWDTVVEAMVQDNKTSVFPWWFRKECILVATGLKSTAPSFYYRMMIVHAIGRMIQFPGTSSAVETSMCDCLRVMEEYGEDAYSSFMHIVNNNSLCEDNSCMSSFVKRVQEEYAAKPKDKTFFENVFAFQKEQVKQSAMSIPQVTKAAMISVGNTHIDAMLETIVQSSFTRSELNAFIANVFLTDGSSILNTIVQKIKTNVVPLEEWKVQGLHIAVAIHHLWEMNQGIHLFNINLILQNLLVLLQPIANKELTMEQAVSHLPDTFLEMLASVSCGMLQRAKLHDRLLQPFQYDLAPYGHFAIQVATEQSVVGDPIVSSPLLSVLSTLVQLHRFCVEAVVQHIPALPDWQCALADLTMHPLTIDMKSKIGSRGDYKKALILYLTASSLKTNYFQERAPSVYSGLGEGTVVRMICCLSKMGHHLEAAVLCQTTMPVDYRRGLQLLQMNPSVHSETTLAFFWDMSFLEVLVNIHSQKTRKNERFVTLLTKIIQSPELNISNSLRDTMHNRLTCTFYQDLCKIYL